MNPSVLDHLVSKQGHYRGTGTNPEGQPYQASLSLKSVVGGNAIEIRFLASDSESAFHEELTVITTDLFKNSLALYTVSSNTPGMLKHILVEDAADEIRERRLVFRLGDRDDLRMFRQEVTLDLMMDGSIEYRYSWGVPHEKLAIQNHAVLKMIQEANQEASQMPGQSSGQSSGDRISQ